eukprot:TRINITY_DN2145_c0_g1_i5.p1 TRINITY_DN2145_c0_g1~~TRINITY_DN2145_c0_g1_i5.p1  ORF type:complete len:183 (-),score=46.53 TRINITY_DN2145_c0_g1_i5:103-651(-)
MRKYPLVQQQISENTNEYWLWHGTTPATVSQLRNTQVSLDSRTVATHTGMGGLSSPQRGLVFSDFASMANRRVPCSICGNGCVGKGLCNCAEPTEENQTPYCAILCRVNLGNCFVTESKSNTLGPNSLKITTGPFAGKHYDSCACLETLHPGLPPEQQCLREFVVFDSALVYAEYLVYYNRI